jgi:hypothetical protein
MTVPRWWLPTLATIVFAVADLVTPLPATATVFAAASPASTVLLTGLPDRALTPGATNPAVTQGTIGRTICVTGWTDTIRPSSRYTRALELHDLAAYGFTDRSTDHYEEDHLIPLELGGAPTDPANLWPEPYHLRVADGTDLGAYAKDRLETFLRKAVCGGRMTLVHAQAEIRESWVHWWRIAFGVPGPSATSSQVIHVGEGAARLTRYNDGTAVLYVNLRGLAPGAWNEHLWSGSCEALGARTAVLPGLVVPGTGAITRTNVLTAAEAAGRTVRIVHGSTAICASFPASG